MDEEERAKWERLKKQIYEDCKKACVPEKLMLYVDIVAADDYFEHRSGYCRVEGFYYIFMEKGYYKTEYLGDENGMRFFLLKNIFISIGTHTECENRDSFAQEWKYYKKTVKIIKPKKYVYDVEYDSRKFWFEYTINSIDKILGTEYSSQVIEEYTQYMNRWFDDEHWAFDRESGKFIEISKSEEKK